jgi:aquaporin rerated protein, other eukaryote
MAIFSNLRIDIQAAALEFVGTAFFLLLGLGGIQAVSYNDDTSPPVSAVVKVHVISTAMGLSLLASAWLFFRITGALFNPNVTLALFLVGAIGAVRFVLYCVAEMAGAIVASALILALTPGPLAFKYVSADSRSYVHIYIEVISRIARPSGPTSTPPRASLSRCS